MGMEQDIQDIIKDIAEHFLKCGYQHVIINVWKQRRIYIALDHAQVEFCYEMDRDFHIWSKAKLLRKDCRKAKELIPFLKQHNECLTTDTYKGYLIGEVKDKTHIYNQVEARIM